MRASIRIVISLMILQAVALQSVAQRRSRSAPKNNPTQVRELIHAADRGDLEKVLELLDKGVNVNAIYDGDNGDNVDDIQLSGRLH